MSLAIALKISFGQWLKLMRSALKVPQSKMASDLGVKVQTISNWENNKSIPNLDPEQTRKLCSLLDVEIDMLAKAYRGKVEIND